MKRLVLTVLFGAALGLVGLAEPAAAQLPPAQDEVQALREAWGNVLSVFEEFLTEFKGAVNTLNRNDQDLYSKYRILTGQIKDLEVKLFQLQEMCSQKIPALEKSLSDCATQLSALRKSLEDVVSGYKAADADLEAKLSAVIGDLRKALEKAFTELNAADKELADKLAAVDNKLSELESRLAADIGSLRSALADAVSGYQAADKDLAQKIAGLASQMDQLSSRVTTLESYDIGNLSRRVLSLEQAIQAIQIKIENNREKIAALEKTIGGLSADISALKESVLTLEARVTDHDARLGSLETAMGTNIQDLTSRLDTIQALAILGLLAGIGAILLVLLGLGG